jgi:methionyl-tRNA formyltransferase
MKVLVLAGTHANQKALCHKIAEVCDLSAIVVSDNIPRKKTDLTRQARLIINRIGNRIVGWPLVDAWSKTLAAYETSFPQFPDVPLIKVRNVNDDSTLEALKRYSPDLTVVSGTNLIGQKVIEFANARGGIINLHTGISPYVKGGPNCTNWCLAKNWFHLIGNTIMWLDSGIDAGSIIATERTSLTGNETLQDLQTKVMDHAHDLYVSAIRQLAKGDQVPSVPQRDIAVGTTFYTVDWNMSEIRNAIKNFRENYRAFFYDIESNRQLLDAVKLVGLI